MENSKGIESNFIKHDSDYNDWDEIGDFGIIFYDCLIKDNICDALGIDHETEYDLFIDIQNSNVEILLNGDVLHSFGFVATPVFK